MTSCGYDIFSFLWLKSGRILGYIGFLYKMAMGFEELFI
ncbi:unknown [[Mannheimia] succiniciproducens MBEL55E]|uniref:Uncharacterized protein n=1 Tax=Mannheimia succiniciproducens (strain KCTC 0769BP / MBEL55E) TaxID=221988 RepID=Q65T64_MANSM|nr:unknown [[Mannheimia] succiniciproducens MBEL55E]